MAVEVVSVKLPTFWPDNPKSWFIQAEAEFSLRKITVEDTKYSHVVAALNPQIASRCTSILVKKPTENPYAYLKEALINRYQLSEEERADRLLDMQTLGDRRPSDLAEAILELNGDEPDHMLLRRIFMRALPPQVRNALSTSSHKDLRVLAREADRVVVTTGHHAAALCNQVDAPTDSRPLRRRIFVDESVTFFIRRRRWIFVLSVGKYFRRRRRIFSD